MARPRKGESEPDRVETWQTRIRQSQKVFRAWDSRFRTRILEDYYLGHQQGGSLDPNRPLDTIDPVSPKYIINRTYASIEAAKPALLFTNPSVTVEPKPSRIDEPTTGNLEEQARLSQDAVQTFIDDPEIEFDLETNLALHEAFFRFGVVEVGYSADWVENPNVDKPLLKEDEETPIVDEQGELVRQPGRVITKESLFVKRIPAKQFRVGLSSKNALGRNDWVGYWEWHYLEDLKRHPVYKHHPHIGELKQTGVVDEAYRDLTEGTIQGIAEAERREGMVRVWKLWDLRARERLVLADGFRWFLDKDVRFTVAPFAVLKFCEILDDFYPMPPVFQWLGPQDELNDTREGQRVHRKRFYRRYTYAKGAFDAGELEKLETGGDGVYAEHKGSAADVPLKPVPDAPLDASIWQHTRETTEDFREVSGVSSEQSGVAQSTTATQANIVNVRGQLREAAHRAKVAKWLTEIARLMLLTIREKMSLPFWVRLHVDPTSLDPLAEALEVAGVWQQIQVKDLGDFSFDVSVDLASLSPVTEEAQRVAWNQVLALLTNPTVMIMLGGSPALMRKTLKLYGIRSENEIQEIQKIAATLGAMMATQLGQQGSTRATGPVGLPAGPGTSAAEAGMPLPPKGPALQAMDRMA